MKIEIIFDEENNDFAIINLDGRLSKLTKNKMTTDGTRDSIGYLILSRLFDVVPDILELRAYQERRDTWDVLDQDTLDYIEENLCE